MMTKGSLLRDTLGRAGRKLRSRIKEIVGGLMKFLLHEIMFLQVVYCMFF
jgi:hypothetical protein